MERPPNEVHHHLSLDGDIENSQLAVFPLGWLVVARQLGSGLISWNGYAGVSANKEAKRK